MLGIIAFFRKKFAAKAIQLYLFINARDYFSCIFQKKSLKKRALDKIQMSLQIELSNFKNK